MSVLNINARSLGVSFSNGTAEILVWAPKATVLHLRIKDEKRIPFQKQENGYWFLSTQLLQAGDRYKLVIDNTHEFPDPCSLSQPDGVHGFSEALDILNFQWTDAGWKNMPLHQYIIYELHTGTFTNEGTLESIARKLDHLKSLGITTVELMPLASFPGQHNWGYDGVFLFSVQESYGGAGALQALVDLCHEKGFAVILDVVYNHFGPEGNYMEHFGSYFTEKYKTPWGAAINYDDAQCDEVRRFFIENALMWLRDFHIDALRLDAVHAIRDFSAAPFLKQLKQEVSRLSEQLDKPLYLIPECDLNDPRFIDPFEKNGFGLDAQWNDEFHHALRVTAGEKREGYYSDFNGIAHLAKGYTDGFVYTGQYSAQRQRHFGAALTDFKGEQLVVFSQNHDQVGNRMLGERSSVLFGTEMQKLMATAVMISPYVPLLFMGEEWGETNPFLYFADHSDAELIESVRNGRREEFKAFQKEDAPPDPFDQTTFERSTLQWELLKREPHAALFKFYRQLIALRKEHFSPDRFLRENLTTQADELKKTLIIERWNQDTRILCLMNFSEAAHALPLPQTATWNLLLDTSENGRPVQKKFSGTINVSPHSALIFTSHV